MGGCLHARDVVAVVRVADAVAEVESVDPSVGATVATSVGERAMLLIMLVLRGGSA